MRKELLLVVASILVTLVALEGATRIYYTGKDRIPPHPDPSTRDEWGWVQNHLDSGNPAAEAMAGFDPNLGWKSTDDIDGWVRQKGYGLPQGDLAAPADKQRYLFIGDSFTQGLYVADQENFAWQFGANHMPDAQILNLGVAGYGPDQMLLLYESIGRHYQPNVVVMGFYVRGIHRALASFTYYAKPWFEPAADDELVLHGVPVLPPATLIGEYESGARAIAGEPYSYLWGALLASVERLGSERRMEDGNTPRWTLMRAILTRFATTVQTDGAAPVLLIIPSRLEDFSDSIHEDLDRLASEEACRLGILPVSLAPALLAAEVAQEIPTFRPREDGGHLSVRGHEVAAEELARVLANPRSAGCSSE